MPKIELGINDAEHMAERLDERGLLFELSQHCVLFQVSPMCVLRKLRTKRTCEARDAWFLALYAKGFSHSEIAALHDFNNSSVTAAIARARNRIKKR